MSSPTRHEPEILDAPADLLTMAVTRSDESPVPTPAWQTIEEVFAALESPLLIYARRLLGSVEVSEDIVQEAFMKLHAQFSTVLSPQPWLYRTVHNLAVDHQRRASKIVLVGDTGEDDPYGPIVDASDSQPLPDEQIARWEGIGLVRLVLETLLHAGLSSGELVLRYQPQVDMVTGAVTGAEALVRWQRPAGLVPPDRFIPAAETTGLIVDLDLWVLRTACEQARAWPGLRIAVNVSSRTLAAPDFAATVLGAVAAAGIAPQQLEVEITESLELFEGEHAVSELAVLREHGVHVALDDFGTGYSNVRRLRHLPIDRVKIDQALVRDIGAGSAGALCDVIVGLARTLDLDVIAEGVETEEQRAYLQALGCPEFQGYLRSAPVSADDFAALLS